MNTIKHATPIHRNPPAYFGVLVLDRNRKILMREVFVLHSGMLLSTKLDKIHVPDNVLNEMRECHVVELAM